MQQIQIRQNNFESFALKLVTFIIGSYWDLNWHEEADFRSYYC